MKDGRFLFGHGIVDEGRGGIFILDVSNAQPHSAPDFVVHQLTQMLEFWCVVSCLNFGLVSRRSHVNASLAFSAEQR